MIAWSYNEWMSSSRQLPVQSFFRTFFVSKSLEASWLKRKRNEEKSLIIIQTSCFTWLFLASGSKEATTTLFDDFIESYYQELVPSLASVMHWSKYVSWSITLIIIPSNTHSHNIITIVYGFNYKLNYFIFHLLNS